MNRGEKSVPQNGTKVFAPCIHCPLSELSVSYISQGPLVPLYFATGDEYTLGNLKHMQGK